MGKVYIVNFTNFEYTDEYYYESGYAAPNQYFSKRSEAEKQLLETYKHLLTNDKDALQAYLYERSTFDADIIEVQHEFKLIGSSIQIPLDEEDKDSWERNYDWIPKQLTDQEVKVFMKYLSVYLGSIVELTKHV